jgi:hypothetical protein
MKHKAKTQIGSHVNPEVYLDPTTYPFPCSAPAVPLTTWGKRPPPTTQAQLSAQAARATQHVSHLLHIVLATPNNLNSEPAPLFAPKAQGTDIAIRCLQYLHLFPTADPSRSLRHCIALHYDSVQPSQHRDRCTNPPRI